VGCPSHLLAHPMLTLVVVTIKSLKHRLDLEEAQDLRRGHAPPHTTTPSAFIGNALQIEEKQCVLHHSTFI
jgi:hypothetical protein